MLDEADYEMDFKITELLERENREENGHHEWGQWVSANRACAGGGFAWVPRLFLPDSAGLSPLGDKRPEGWDRTHNLCALINDKVIIWARVQDQGDVIVREILGEGLQNPLHRKVFGQTQASDGDEDPVLWTRHKTTHDRILGILNDAAPLKSVAKEFYLFRLVYHDGREELVDEAELISLDGLPDAYHPDNLLKTLRQRVSTLQTNSNSLGEAGKQKFREMVAAPNRNGDAFPPDMEKPGLTDPVEHIEITSDLGSVAKFKEQLNTEFLDRCGIPRELATAEIGPRSLTVFDLAHLALRRLDQRICRWIEDALTQHQHAVDYSDCTLHEVNDGDHLVLTLIVRGKAVASTTITTVDTYAD